MNFVVVVIGPGIVAILVIGLIVMVTVLVSVIGWMKLTCAVEMGLIIGACALRTVVGTISALEPFEAVEELRLARHKERTIAAKLYLTTAGTLLRA